MHTDFDPRQIVDALYRAYNAHDAEGAASLYASTGVHEEVADGRVAVGQEAIRSGLERLFAAFPDAEWVLESVVIDDGQAVAPYRLTGTLRGELGPFLGLGQRLDLRGIHVLAVDGEGRIERSADYWDAATFRRQMDPEAAPALELPATGFAPDDFREAMRLLAGGVAVVTTEVDGRPWGLTVSACCSLTAEPPRILVSLGSGTVTMRSIVDHGGFGVALLGADQVEAARVCAATGQPKFIDGFTVDLPRTDIASPVVRGALVHLDCAVERSYPIGDHRLVVGLVREAIVSEDTSHDPLVYFERRFRGIGTPIA